MSYTSLSFLAFVAATCLLYFIIPKKFRWIVLLAASTAFYVINAKWNTVYIFLSAAVLYFAALLIERETKAYKAAKEGLQKEERKLLKKKSDRKKRLYLTIGVIADLSMLLVLKYTGFFISAAGNIISLFGGKGNFEIIRFILPLGISYYTLTGISYLTDVYRGEIASQKNPAKLALFLIYFPGIVEGPFSRYGELSQTLFEGNRFSYSRFLSGFIRICWGFFKKLALADRTGVIVDAVFADNTAFGGAGILMAIIGYTFQIYCDFSGCMDIVIGISEILGVRLSENFNQPFFSKSIDEFWRRWHITLGAWLKDYVFYPISLSSWNKKLSQAGRKKFGSYYGSLIAASAALFFVWILIGFWHGSGLKYIFYGLYYFLLMMLGKYLQPMCDKILALLKIKRENKAYGIFQTVRTILLVCIGMLIFRASSLHEALLMFRGVFTSFSLKSIADGSLLKAVGMQEADLAVIISGLLVIIVVGVLREKGVDIRKKILSRHLYVFITLFVLMLAIIILGKYGADSQGSAFLYGQF